MPPARDDPRGRALRDLDVRSLDFREQCALRLTRGLDIAEADLDRLSALAERVGSDACSWTRALSRCEAAVLATLDPLAAARLVVETVFDDCLTPAACRVLDAAVVLSFTSRAAGAA
jgi:hypothetical protein